MCSFEIYTEFSTHASGDDSSNLSLVMVRMNENVLEDSVQGLLDLYKGDHFAKMLIQRGSTENGLWEETTDLIKDDILFCSRIVVLGTLFLTFLIFL